MSSTIKDPTEVVVIPARPDGAVVLDTPSEAVGKLLIEHNNLVVAVNQLIADSVAVVPTTATPLSKILVIV